MDRRHFLKLSGSFLLLNRLGMTNNLWAKEPSVVSISEGKDYGAITKTAIEAIGGVGRFVKAGNTVVIKPNIGWDRKPEQAATTHPSVIRAIAEECVKAGAKRVKVFDNTCNDARRCYTNSGIQAALKDMKNVDVKFMEPERYKKVNLRGVFLKEWELYDEALSADVLINVPIAKHHSLTGLTLALKNMMGIMGGNRGFIHRQIEDAVADVNSAVKSHLVVIDATRILTAHGPTGGSLKDVKILNKIIASTDPVAADSVATGLFGLKPQDVPITVTGHKRGLGEMNLDRIKTVKT
jgi:uncharacterized protein (DUF362 family)